MLLSILIPTLYTREILFKGLINKLQFQIDTFDLVGEVEILTVIDNRENTTGFKRNMLLESAKGKFVVFVDDDDDVSEKYLKLICDIIKQNQNIDCIGINGIYTEKSKQFPFETSLKHNWEFVDGWFLRTINHISPVKREHAIKVKFPNKTIQEDYDWTMELKSLNLLKKEVVIKEPVYFYNFVKQKNY